MDKSRMKWKFSKAPASFRANFESPVWMEIVILMFLLATGLQIYGIVYKSGNLDKIEVWKEKYKKDEAIILKVVDRVPFQILDKNGDKDKSFYGLVCEKDGEFYNIPVRTTTYYKKQVGDTLHYTSTKYDLAEKSQMFNDTDEETVGEIESSYPLNKKFFAALLAGWIGALLMFGFGTLIDDGEVFTYRAENEFKNKSSWAFLGWIGFSVVLTLIGIII